MFFLQDMIVENNDTSEVQQRENSPTQSGSISNILEPQPSTSKELPSFSIDVDDTPPLGTQNIRVSPSVANSTTPRKIIKGITKGKSPKKNNIQALSIAVNEVRKVHESLTRNSNESTNQRHGTQNANSAFGSYVALMLDQLPFNTSILAQSEIQSVLLRFLVPSSSMSHRSTPMQTEVFSPPPQSEQNDITIIDSQDVRIYAEETQPEEPSSQDLTFILRNQEVCEETQEY